MLGIRAPIFQYVHTMSYHHAAIPIVGRYACSERGLGMLTGIHITFIGGDARQIEVIKKCSALDATISLIGFNQLKNEFPGAQKVNIDHERF
jgi:hypothetical protein